MGLLQTGCAASAPPLPPGSGSGRRVVIVGAGIAGMTAAYELRKAGYDCIVLEARDRPGGRVWTIRGGDRVVEQASGQTVASEQTVPWPTDGHLYFNAGAARLAQHHRGILSYCREFEVPLETFVNGNHAAFVQNDSAFDGQPQRIRRLLSDTRGALSATVARTASDMDLRALLKLFGDLDEDLNYVGSGRAGYAVLPGAADQAGTLLPVLPFDAIAKAAAARSVRLATYFTELWHQAPTMLQPVGGMDAIPRAFAHALGPAIKYRAEVVRLGRAGEGAQVAWRDLRNGQVQTIDADFVICTAPLPVLQDIASDFSDRVKGAIAAGASIYLPVVKIAFHSARRWWEADHQIYGGISWTADDITQIWYPSHAFHRPSGIVVGAYIWTAEIAKRFAAMTPERRLAVAVSGGERVHPGYQSLVQHGVSVAWSNVPYSRGGWAEWTPETRRDAYPVLCQADGPFHFAGEHLSYITGWQEGAVQSAFQTVGQIRDRRRTGGPARRRRGQA